MVPTSLNFVSWKTAYQIALSVGFAAAINLPTGITGMKTIDSHLHVWANSIEAMQRFPYQLEPPAQLKDRASTEALLEQMEMNGVDGALILQPINHRFDHSYVIDAIKSHPDKFKGMLLHDPSLDEAEAVTRLEELTLKGFVGVRFNPYLWPSRGENQWSPMSAGPGLRVYQRCGELGIPVGIMCFQGLTLHLEDIKALMKASPATSLILDHFGFVSVNNQNAFDHLLGLAHYPNVYVKISALFRLEDTSPYERVRKERFLPLLLAFGARRLLYGSDFPFVLEQPESYRMAQLVSSWVDDPDDRLAIMGGTSERLFGAWGPT